MPILFLMSIFVIWTFTSIGLIFDDISMAWVIEAVRIILFALVFNQPLVQSWAKVAMVPLSFPYWFYGISLAVACGKTAQMISS